MDSTMSDILPAPSRIILGSGRSGTTWIQDSLAEANQLRPIFEPLHEAESSLGHRYAYELLEPGEVNETLERFFRDLCQGRLHSRWIDFRGPRRLLFPSPRKLMTLRGLRSWGWIWRRYMHDRSALHRLVNRSETLIKCVRANLMAGWLAQDLGFRTALIVRHPCASVESQFGNSYIWDPVPVAERYRNNRRLNELTEERYVGLLNSKLTRLQALTLNWVIENQRPVARAEEEGYGVFYYENFLNEPSREWPRICSTLELKSVPGTELLDKPSQQSYVGLERQPSFRREPRWRQKLTQEQLAEIQGILDATEFELYSIRSIYPLNQPECTVP